MTFGLYATFANPHKCHIIREALYSNWWPHNRWFMIWCVYEVHSSVWSNAILAFSGSGAFGCLVSSVSSAGWVVIPLLAISLESRSSSCLSLDTSENGQSNRRTVQFGYNQAKAKKSIFRRSGVDIATITMAQQFFERLCATNRLECLCLDIRLLQLERITKFGF